MSVCMTWQGEDTLDDRGHAVELSSISTAGELMGQSLGPAPDSVLEPGLKVPIVWWCSLCQDPETEAIPAVSRRHPLGLSLNWGYPGMDSFCQQNLEWGCGEARQPSWSGCLYMSFHLTVSRWCCLATCLGQIQVTWTLSPPSCPGT